MVTRRNLSAIALIATCITASLFMIVPATGVPPYDPWLDANDDGYIGIDDIFSVASHFGAEGTPINKTQLQLELLTARTHNETYSTTTETRSGYAWDWEDIPETTVTVTVETSCTLLIMFSSEAITTTAFLELYVRAMVDSTPANPPAVTLTKGEHWASYSFTFYSQNVAPGTHTVRIQWSYNDEVGSVQLARRSLVVISLLP